MGKINYGRVLLGGLLAGFIINVGEFILNDFVLAEQMAAVTEALGLSGVGNEQIAGFVVIAFVFGIALVWLYAAIRPRFGAGPKTAVIAGVVTWLIGACLPAGSYTIMGVLPTDLAVIGCVWSLVEFSLAGVAGAWLYKEGA